MQRQSLAGRGRLARPLFDVVAALGGLFDQLAIAGFAGCRLSGDDQ